MLGGDDGLRFTRQGLFVIDQKGALVHVSGRPVMALDETGRLTALRPARSVLAPRATTTVRVAALLDSDAPLKTFDPADPRSTSNGSASMTVYDARGVASLLELFFKRTGSGAWEFVIQGPGGPGGWTMELGRGAMTFEPGGALDTVTSTLSFIPPGQSAPQPLRLDLGDDIASGGTGWSGTIEAAISRGVEVMNTTADGFPVGLIGGFSLDETGALVVTYTNQQRERAMRLAVASFKAPQQLSSAGDGLYAENSESGPPLLGQPLTGSFGAVRPWTLEHPCQR